MIQSVHSLFSVGGDPPVIKMAIEMHFMLEIYLLLGSISEQRKDCESIDFW